MTPDTQHSQINALMHTALRASAWPAFQRRYEDTIRRWCRGRGLQDADADDLTQEILARLFRDLAGGRFDPDRGRFRTYLALVVRSAVHHHLEREGRRPGARGPGGTVNLELVERLAAAPATDSVSDAVGADVLAALDRVLARLKAGNRDAVRRVLLLGESPVDVARELNLSPTGLMQAVARARGYFREEYDAVLAEPR